ncbi:MAG: M48 family metallopeptidase, partial [Planctomycetaceae bacterium]|nr:M48 family metallopeptidase [Planctomycetaceae bacterium]
MSAVLLAHARSQPSSRGPDLRFRGTTWLIAALILAMAAGCSNTPLTGRRQMVLVPESQEVLLGTQAFQQILVEKRLSENKDLAAAVNRVGRRIADVANKPGYDWEFRVIADDEMNAFALPGGKVAIHEGIIPICQDEAGLAVVMSHEIGHVLARHGAERMTQETIAAGAGGVLNSISREKTDSTTSDQIMQGYGIASRYGVLLPYSRKHESEADAIGLILMAKAGYDPSAAPEFWERFAQKSGAKPPELLSTHPADARRAAALRVLLPSAMNYYDASSVQLGMGDVLPKLTQRTQVLNAAHGRTADSNLAKLSHLPGAPKKATESALSPPLPQRRQVEQAAGYSVVRDGNLPARSDTSGPHLETFESPVIISQTSF